MNRTKADSAPSRIDPPAPAKGWWNRSFRIVQTNLRLIDVRQKPDTIAKAVREFGGSAIVSNMGGIAAFYPTQLDLHWTNPYLEGDFVGEMIEAAHAQGLAYIGRLDLSKGMAAAYTAHPDWFMRNRDGNPRVYQGTYQACPNGGWARKYGFEIMREALTVYDVDGIFFNMTGYPIKDYDHAPQGACLCDNCARRFRDMYGRTLPTVDGFADPAWSDYLEFQRRTASELAVRSRELIRELRPDVGIIGIRPEDDMIRYESQRRTYRPAPEWPHQAGEQSRWMRSQCPDRPTASTSAAHIDYPWRQVTETSACHLLRFAQQIASGSSLDLYLMGTLADQDDPRYLAPVGDLFRWFARHANRYTGLEDAGRIGLYISGVNKQGVTATSSGSVAEATFRGAYAMLVDARLPFAFVNDRHVREGAVDVSARFDAIVLPDIALLDRTEAAQLDAFVERGGVLITTGQTARYDADASPHTSVPLRSSPVAAYGEPVNAHGWSFDGTGAAFPCSARIPATGLYWPVVKREGTQVLLPAAPPQPFGPPEFSYAEPDAPRPPHPGALARRHGKGWAIHLPWQPEWHYHRDGLPEHRALLEALLYRYAPAPPVRLDGLGPIELTVQRQAGGKQLLVHVINYAGQRNTRYEDPPLLHGLRLGLKGAGDAAKALVAGISMEAGTADAQGYRWFALPPVGHFEAIALELA